MDLSGFMAAARGALLSEHRWELEQTFRNLMLHENMNLEKGLSKQKKVGSSYSQGVEEEVGERERDVCVGLIPSPRSPSVAHSSLQRVRPR